jgi:hypothetical protein
MPKRMKVQRVSGPAKQRRTVGNDQKEEFWRKHIAAWRASGVSKRAYCTQHDVGYWSFVDWVRKIELRDSEKVPARIAARLIKGNAKGGNPFVPIRVVQPDPVPTEEPVRGGGETAVGGQEIEIVLPSGVVIRLHDNCNAVFVANLLSALKA